MTIKNQIEQLKKLSELGDKATQGDWLVFTKVADENMPAIGDVYIPSPDKGGFSIHRNCNPVNNAIFLAQSANARQAIKDVLAYFERVESNERRELGVKIMEQAVMEPDGWDK